MKLRSRLAPVLNRRNGSSGRETELAARWNQRLALGVTGVLGLTELGVAAGVSLPAGIGLLGLTGGLGYLVRRGERFASRDRERAMHAFAERHADSLRYDAQTGLPNRQQLLDQLEREIARGARYEQQVTLAVAEIARFEEFASLWGEAAADRAVAHVAETLKRVTRSSDYVARLDRDRFAVVLVQCTAEQAHLFAQRVELASGNRPLQAGRGGRLPVYVKLDVAAQQFDPARFRGPLDFLSVAGGDSSPREGGNGKEAPRAGHPLRRQLIRDYYPEGKADDFATAYRHYRGVDERAG